MADTRKTGSFQGQSNALGHGGRAAQLKAAGVPGGVIGAIARRKGAAPGGPNYHGGMAHGGAVTSGTHMLPGMNKMAMPKDNPNDTPAMERRERARGIRT